MAIIHHGKNGLKEKLDSYYEERLENRKIALQSLNDEAEGAYRRAVPKRIALLAASVAVIAVLVLFPVIVQSIQTAADQMLTNLENGIADAMRGAMKDSPEDIGPVLLNLLLSCLSFIVSGLVWLTHVSSGVLVYLICFGVPACVAYVSVKGLLRRPKPMSYTDDELREMIRNEGLTGDMRIVQVGLEGEERATELLGRLGSDCHIFTNLKIHHHGGVSETDVIVVAPHNVTIVEVKNYRDELEGDWSDEHLTLKAERGRTTHESQVYNPVKQVATHAERLTGYLREHGVSARVNCCVFFVNESVSLYGVDDRANVREQCPVFHCHYLDSLLGYLQAQQKNLPGARVAKLLTELADEQAQE